MSDATTRWAYLRQLLLVLLVVSSLFVVPVAAQEDSDDSDDSDTSQSIVCDVGIFKSLMNITLQTILVGYSPIAVVGLAGERLTSALPFIPQSYRKSLMKWRNAVIAGGRGPVYWPPGRGDYRDRRRLPDPIMHRIHPVLIR